jgi:hypothetical protein
MGLVFVIVFFVALKIGISCSRAHLIALLRIVAADIVPVQQLGGGCPLAFSSRAGDEEAHWQGRY